MAKKQPMKWEIRGPQCLRVLRDDHGGKIVAEFRGSGQLLADDLQFPEILQAIATFREGAEFQRLEKLRKDIRHHADMIATAEAAAAELRDNRSDDARAIVYAADDVDSLSRQRDVLQQLTSEAYRECQRVLSSAISEAQSQVLQQAKVGKAAAVERFVAVAGDALTELLSWHVRLSSATRTPDLQTVLGPAPAAPAAEPEADDDGLPFKPLAGAYSRVGDPIPESLPEPKAGPLFPEPVPMTR